MWGDGLQTRSYCYVDDCVEGIYRLMRADYASRSIWAPIDWSPSISWSTWWLASAGKTIYKRHDLTKPQGVRGRN